MAKSFLDNNMKFDRILSFGLLATTALYFDRKKLAFILAAPLLKLGITKSMKYIGTHCFRDRRFEKKYSKYVDPIFDMTMYCFKAPMQDAAIGYFGEAYGSLLGKAGALFIARINQEFADCIFKDGDEKQNQKEALSEKVHNYLPIFCSGVHIALGFIVRDSIDSRLKIPLLSLGVIASSALLYFIKPTEKDKSGNDKYTGIISCVASHFALLNLSHISFTLLSSTPILSEHSQVCHFITNKARTLLSSYVRDYTNSLGK